MPTRPGDTDDGPLSRALELLDDHEQRIEDLHKRIRPLESYAEQGRPLHLRRIDQLETHVQTIDERWQALDREMTRLRTTIALAGAAIALVSPLLTALLLRLLR